MTKPFIIKTDVTDWAEENARIEPKITNEGDVVSLVIKDGLPIPQVARLTIIDREKGLAPVDIIPANKLLMMTGAAKHISSVIASKRIEAQTPSGNTYTVREFVAPVREGEDDHGNSDTQSMSVTPSSEPETFAPVQSEEGNGRAWNYLLKRVPGYIYGRLKIIAVNGGDVKEAAEELKNKIDELVLRLG